MKAVIWVLVNSNNAKEAKFIGDQVLAARLAAGYSLISKSLNKYYWPPQSGKFETNTGPQLVLETLPKNYLKIVKLIKIIHSDKVPFMGRIRVDGVGMDFYAWMRGEIK